MSRRPREDRIQAVILFYTHGSGNGARLNWPEDEAPTVRFIERWASLFEEFGVVNDSSRSGRPPSSLTDKNKQKILQDINKDPEASFRDREKEIKIPHTTIQRFTGSLNFKSYRIQRDHQLSAGDLIIRLQF
ncbi:MAG: hypothetical protein EZS28_022645 [Streblomastix strix]|uniref:DUF4817 domain-containing protein n=1 Tax=Streblomastix strix TaxID=222440 RepID=A0A5J4VHI9_9EUKA|nr:MAG: hypothetical protein EZS28_022645 [Streblomastix strix]